MHPSENYNSKNIPSPPPPRPLQGARWGCSTLVLNAISPQREKKLNEYRDILKDNPLPEKVRKATHRRCRTRQRFFNGSKQDDGEISHITVYRNACKVHRTNSYSPAAVREFGSKRGKIDSFSDKSRARLKFVAGNCFPLLVSQFCLSYGSDNTPADGVETHDHLSRFLDAVRRKFPGSTYLWVLEFQRRGVPHFHVFFSFPPSQEKRIWLAEKWCKITGGKIPQFMVHSHPNNFVRWEMKKGGYLCKYLEKKEQKNVPNNFENVGRFWGCSRNMVPDPDQWFFSDLEKIVVENTDTITGEVHGVDIPKLLYRTLRKHHESCARLCGAKSVIWKKKEGSNPLEYYPVKVRHKSRITKEYLSTVNLPSGGAVVKQVLDWCMKEDIKSKGGDLF